METTSKPMNKHDRHVAAIPYPGRGHVNPMLNFCRQLVSRDVHVSFIVTKEWLGLLGSELRSDELISFVTVADDVIPSEKFKGADIKAFFKAVEEDLQEPVERLVKKLEPKPDLIVVDSVLNWGVEVGKKMKIPVASFWPAGATEFSILYHHELILNSSYYPIDLSGNASEERIDFIPGIPSIRLADLPAEFQLNDKEIISILTTSASNASKAECIIFRTINELEETALTAVKATITPPIYTIGPAIPYFKRPETNPDNTPDYIKWLDTQQQSSVLYVSQGSAHSASNAQINELIAGLKDSEIPFLWVGRNQSSELSVILGERGIVIEWCDQIRVLSHSSIGGFLTHCGWNSTLESAFVGVPILTLPICFDQFVNSKIIVEDWRIGWRVKNKCQDLATREQIAALLKKFMDLEGKERKELESNCKKLKEKLLAAVREDGSVKALDEFILDFLPICN